MARKRPQHQSGLNNPAALKKLPVKLDALDLRKRGYSYRDIAQALGLKSRALAHHHVQSLLEEVVIEPAKELLCLEVARIDDCIKAWYPLAMQRRPLRNYEGEHVCDEHGNPCYVGDYRAAEVLAGYLERRWKLLGIISPQKQAQEDPRQVILAVLKRVITDASGQVTHEEVQSLQVETGPASDIHDVSHWLPAEQAREAVLVPEEAPNLPPVPPGRGKRPALPAPPGVGDAEA